MDDHCVLEVIGHHHTSLTPGARLEVHVHRAHPGDHILHRVTAVRLMAGGGDMDTSDDLVFSHDCRELAENLRSAAALAAGEVPERAPAAGAAEVMNLAGLAPDEVAEARYRRGYPMATDTGSAMGVGVHLAHDAPDPGHFAFVHVMVMNNGVPGLDFCMTPAEAAPVVASLLAAAEAASPRADPRYIRLGLAGCLEPTGIHSGHDGTDTIVVTAHAAHEHRKAWHQAATISVLLMPGGGGKAVTVRMPAADARELAAVLRKAVERADSLESIREEEYLPAGEVAAGHSVISAGIHVGHEGPGEEQTLVELSIQPGGTRPQEASIGLPLPEGDRLVRSLERALGIVAEQIPG